MSLISARPMIVSLSLCVTVMGQLLVRDGWKAGRMKVWMKARGRIGLAEVDVVGRGEEVADDETGRAARRAGRPRGAAGSRRPAGRGTRVATRMIRGRPSTVSWPSVSPGSLASISDEVLSLRSSCVACTTQRTSRSSKSSAPSRWALQPGEEVLELADAQRLEQHVLAAGEHPVQRRPRHAGLGGDVFDGDLGDAPPLAARLGGVEHA